MLLLVELDSISIVGIVLGPIAVGAVIGLIGWKLGRRDQPQ